VITIAVVGDIFPPRERGRYQGYFGGVFGVSTVLGPLLGGFFVDHLSWRWIFYVNLPIGLIALAVIATAFQPRTDHVKHTTTYLPLYLQDVKGHSPTTSGLLILPLMVGLLTASIGSGQLITRFGRYKPFPVAGTAIMVVGLFLLSRLQVDTSTVVTGAYMLVLGFGLGNVIQVLVLAAQNAVDYKYLGVASSGSTLFRQIGGSIGVSVFGAIFANQLAANLVGKLPPSARVPSSAANPAVVKQLPAVLRDPFRIAITDALTTVFLVAAGIAVLAFLLTWLLPEVPLKTTAGAPDPGDGLHPA